MESAGVTALNAIGKQDDLISSLEYSPEKSIFTPKVTQTSYFSRYYSTHDEYSPGRVRWPFDETITFKLEPQAMGDLLSNMFLKIDLPTPTDGIWTDRIGRALIEQAEFIVNDQTIEILDDYMMVALDDFFTKPSYRRYLNYVLNGELDSGNGETHLPKVDGVSSENLKLIIPLNFFFCRKFSPLDGNPIVTNPDAYAFGYQTDFKEYFPLCAVHKQFIYVRIKFRPQEWFTNATNDITTDKISLLLEEIKLTPIERNYFTFRKFSQIIPIQKKIEKFRIDNSNGTVGGGDTTTLPTIYKHKLVSTDPIKTVYWFFRNVRYDELSDPTNSNVFLNRYNFSSMENTEGGSSYQTDEFSNQIVQDIQLKSDKYDIEFIAGGNTTAVAAGGVYFRSVDGQYKGFYNPERNIYTYSFDTIPNFTLPSGAEKSDTKNYTIVNNFFSDVSGVYFSHVYYSVYKLLTFEAGQVVMN